MAFGKTLFLVTFSCIASLSLFMGMFIYRRPKKVIEIQQKMYTLVNWHMEPISMSKEIRNTRWMGLFLVGFVLFTVIYVIVQV